MYKDNTVKFEHTPVNNTINFPINQIGIDDLIDIEEFDGIISEDIGIIVNTSTGNDTTGDGTLATPYATITKGINSTTESKGYVFITNSSTYNEEINDCTFTNFLGLYADTGCTPKLVLRTLPETYTDGNCIHVSKTGNDSTGDGTKLNPYLTIDEALDNVTSELTEIEILDSGTYTITGQDLPSDLTGIHAAIGYTPTIVCDYINNPTGEITLLQSAETFATNTQQGQQASAGFANGNYIIAVTHNENGSGFLKYYVYDQNNDLVTSGTLWSYFTWSVCVTVDNDDNAVISYTSQPTSTAGQYMAVVSNTGVVVKTATLLISGQSNEKLSSTLDKAGNIIVFGDYNTYGYYVINHTYYTLKTGWTAGATYDIRALTACNDSNGDIILFYVLNGALTAVKYMIFDGDDYSITTAPTSAFTASTNTGNLDVCRLYGEKYVISQGGYAESASNLYLHVYDKTAGTDTPTLLTSTAGDSSINLKVRNDYNPIREIVITYYDMSSPYTNLKYVLYSYDPYYSLRVQSDITLQGLYIKPAESSITAMKYLLLNGGEYDITLKWCNLYDENDSNILTCPIYTDHTLAFYNTVIQSTTASIYAESDDITLQDCIIVWCYNYAFLVDGSGTGITIDHVDIFDNYGGFRLENNTGTEIIKNCIIHSNNVAGINADTDIKINNCVVTGTNFGVTSGDYITTANPQYINEGFTPSEIDLNIKTRVTGYDTNSPALDLGDDDRNAGAYNVIYITVSTSWSSIEVHKPLEIKRYIDYNGTLSKRKDGSTQSKRESATYYCSFKFPALPNNEYLLLQELLESPTSRIRIYFNPTTEPYTFNEWQIEYDKFNDSAKHHKLLRTGRQDVEISFSRKHEVV